jgi:hypothetical protein
VGDGPRKFSRRRELYGGFDVLTAGGTGYDKGPWPVLTPVPVVAVPPISLPLAAACAAAMVPSTSPAANTNNVRVRNIVFSFTIHDFAAPHQTPPYWTGGNWITNVKNCACDRLGTDSCLEIRLSTPSMRAISSRTATALCDDQDHQINERKLSLAGQGSFHRLPSGRRKASPQRREWLRLRARGTSRNLCQLWFE